jgi:hypothetical protein
MDRWECCGSRQTSSFYGGKPGKKSLAFFIRYYASLHFRG